MVSKQYVGKNVSLTWDRGQTIVGRPSLNVIQVRNIDYFSTEGATALLAELDRFFVPGKNTGLFLDWFEMTGYDSGARLAATQWAQGHKHEIRRFHVLVQSKLVAMGVAVANVAVGGTVEAFVSRKVFEKELQNYIARASPSERAEMR